MHGRNPLAAARGGRRLRQPGQARRRQLSRLHGDAIGACAPRWSPERFAQTGTGWVLRELSLAAPERVIGFVEEHRSLFARGARLCHGEAAYRDKGAPESGAQSCKELMREALSSWCFASPHSAGGITQEQTGRRKPRSCQCQDYRLDKNLHYHIIWHLPYMANAIKHSGVCIVPDPPPASALAETSFSFYPPHLRRLFTDRARELDILRDATDQLAAGRPKHLALFGLRRIGKTLLLLEHAVHMVIDGRVRMCARSTSISRNWPPRQSSSAVATLALSPIGRSRVLRPTERLSRLRWGSSLDRQPAFALSPKQWPPLTRHP